MVRIRKARLKDLDELVVLWERFMNHQRELGRKNGRDMLPKMKEEACEIVRSYYSSNIWSRNGYLLVLEDGSSVRGYMLSRIVKNIPVFENEQVGYVSDIYLEPPYRGKGHSTTMFHLTMDWFRKKGITEVSLKVFDYNPKARRVYEKWGFNEAFIEMRLE